MSAAPRDLQEDFARDHSRNAADFWVSLHTENSWVFWLWCFPICMAQITAFWLD